MGIYAKSHGALRKKLARPRFYRHGKRALMVEAAISTNAWRYKRSCLLKERWEIQCDRNVEAGADGLILMICPLRYVDFSNRSPTEIFKQEDDIMRFVF